MSPTAQSSVSAGMHVRVLASRTAEACRQAGTQTGTQTDRHAGMQGLKPSKEHLGQSWNRCLKQRPQSWRHACVTAQPTMTTTSPPPQAFSTHIQLHLGHALSYNRPSCTLGQHSKRPIHCQGHQLPRVQTSQKTSHKASMVLGVLARSQQAHTAMACHLHSSMRCKLTSTAQDKPQDAGHVFNTRVWRDLCSGLHLRHL
jgi:hypothetical protein